MFALHPQLQKDSVEIAQLPLCSVLMARDSRYPWIILVPRRAGVREIFELDDPDQQQLTRESSAVAQALANHFNADKMNVAALGNMVPQLHIHHVVRFCSDPAWPGPIWGALPPVPFSENDLNKRVSEIKSLIEGLAL